EGAPCAARLPQAMARGLDWFLVAAATWAAAASASGCNKALCASDVSKCLLQEVCQCEANRAGCPCCRECAFCLGSLWESCCGCVGLCDERLPSASRPAERSSMHDLTAPVPSLFRALMAISDNDPPMGWSVLTLPVGEELRQNHAETGHLFGTTTSLPGLNATAPPCQSIFFNECLSMSQCRAVCQSVGAWRYRWFHNACCQCLGPDCLGYGGPHAHCSSCRD
uniref:Uncharacterized protein n=1 Tax=Varanus komodoensis TaxID=61221 RepID=A0A8D2JGU3_VARKO